MAQKKQPKKSPTHQATGRLQNRRHPGTPRYAKKDIKTYIDGTGCLHCGSLKIVSRGEVKVFRGQRMKPIIAQNAVRISIRANRKTLSASFLVRC